LPYVSLQIEGLEQLKLGKPAAEKEFKMKRSRHNHGLFLGAGALSLIFMSLVLFWLSQIATSVSADSPRPTPPPLTGEPFTAVLNNVTLNQDPVNAVDLDPGWTVALSETFESGIGFGWTATDMDGFTNGEYKWGAETFTNPNGGTISAWAVGDGQDGGLLDINSDGYPDNVNSWLVYGPVDMSEATAAILAFSYWLETDGGDVFGIATSTNGVNFTGIQPQTDTSGWDSASYDLSSYAGESSVYFAFVFTSDVSGNAGNLPGALVDDIELQLKGAERTYMPIVKLDPTATPLPTPTPIPSGTQYEDKFTNDIDGWAMRRTNTGAYAVEHGGNGYLKVILDNDNDYIIVSPLVAGIDPEYTISISAQFASPEHRDMYGVAFGGDWNGSACPNNDFTSCFNTYYLLKVEYRTDNGNHLRFKLMKVDSHSGNHPVGDNLIEWTDVTTSIDEAGFNKWEINVEEDDDIKIYLNGDRVGTVRDTGMDSFHNPYFGVMAETKENEGSTIKFDHFRITAGNP
jgi:hypothetical protein